MEKSFNYEISDFKSLFIRLKTDNITEFTLHDEKILGDKRKILAFFTEVAKSAPDIFYRFPIRADFIDLETIRVFENLYCSLDIPFSGVSKDKTYLFDKKLFSKKAKLLNDSGLVFGFLMDFATIEGDSVKLFRDRLNFALSLYPNHIEFPVTSSGSTGSPTEVTTATPKPTATFSTQDIKNCLDIAFSVETFYTAGRAVPWFLSVLSELKMDSVAFFKDFSEWQKCNNCDRENPSFSLEKTSHKEIEKMQLNFLEMKFEEKKKQHLFKVVSDLVRLNGAVSRFFAENEKTTLELNYNAEDLFSPVACNISKFCDMVFEEPNKIVVDEKFCS